MLSGAKVHDSSVKILDVDVKIDGIKVKIFDVDVEHNEKNIKILDTDDKFLDIAGRIRGSQRINRAKTLGN